MALEDIHTSRAEVTGERAGVAAESTQRVLDRRCPEVYLLRHRQVPGTPLTIDHIAVSADGVAVIDSQREKGKLEVRGFGRHRRLFVGGRDRTALLLGARAQAELVGLNLYSDYEHLPVRPVLCLVDTEVGFLGSPFELHGCVVTWPRRLARQLRAPGYLTREAQLDLARDLAQRFPVA